MNPEKWATLSLDKKILNIASELGRAAHWLERRDRSSFENAIERALELLDLTVDAEPHLPDSSLREWLRFREWLAGTLIHQPEIPQFTVARRCFLDLQPIVHELRLDF